MTMQNMSSHSRSEGVLYSLQYLRFIAASFVIVTHIYEQIMRAGRGDLPGSFEIGASGVDIFFVISGFLMCVITEKREKTFKDFILSRMVRVMPPYWAVTAFMATVILLMPSLFKTAEVVPAHLIASFLFIAWPHPVLGVAAPLYSPGWTLNYEILFYTSFAFFLKFSLDKKITLASATLLGLVALGLVFPSENTVWQFYTKTILIEFIFGMLVARFYLKGMMPSWPVSLFLLISGFAALFAGHFIWPKNLAADIGYLWTANLRFLVWGLPALMIVAGAAFLDAKAKMFRSQILKILGDASYSAYITHVFVLGGFAVVWKKLDLGEFFPDVVLAIAWFTLSWAVAVAFHLMFEKPVTRWARAGVKRITQGRNSPKHA